MKNPYRIGQRHPDDELKAEVWDEAFAQFVAEIRAQQQSYLSHMGQGIVTAFDKFANRLEKEAQQ